MSNWPANELPYLAEGINCAVTSPKTNRYNCLAWAAEEDFRNWWPDPMRVGYWPPGVAREVTFPAFLEAYKTKGFTLCFDGTLEPNLEKVALYGKGPPGSEVPTHAARQLSDGKWTSKLGPLVDIAHAQPEDVEGPVYGKVICYLSRPR
jgi:hypothetical protein